MGTVDTELFAGCVILFNPENAIISNIKSYLPFLDVLYVIDNSEQINHVLVAAVCAISEKIIYQSAEKNIGVAAALNSAATLAVAAKYNWLLTMDQDSSFINGQFFEEGRTIIKTESDIGLIAASYTAQYDRWQVPHSASFNQIHFIITSGNIINLSAWKKTNGFNNKLFIDEVDHDYCLKLRKHHYKILITKTVFLTHVIGHSHQSTADGLITGKTHTLHVPERYYYISRNVLFLCKTYFFIDLKFVTVRFFYLIKRLAKIILVYPDKTSYLKFFGRGVYDFFSSRYGKYGR